jgi:hypothetical protein
MALIVTSCRKLCWFSKHEACLKPEVEHASCFAFNSRAASFSEGTRSPTAKLLRDVNRNDFEAAGREQADHFNRYLKPI